MKKFSLTCFKIFVFLLLARGNCAHAKSAEISLAAVQLPEGHDGNIKIKTGAESSQNIQLSTRYFSAPVEIKADTALTLYNAKDDPATTPPFIQGIQLTEGERYFGILTVENGKNAQEQKAFKLTLIPITKWPQGSIYIANTSSQKLVMEYDKNRQVLDKKASTVIKAENPARSVSVKIAEVDQNDKSRLKLIFTSTWRISPVRREFCMIYLHNGRIRLRSLMEKTLPEPGSQ